MPPISELSPMRKVPRVASVENGMEVEIIDELDPAGVSAAVQADVGSGSSQGTNLNPLKSDDN